MDTKQDKISIKVVYQNDSKIYNVSRLQEIKNFLCGKYQLTEKEIVVKINNITCGASESFEQYIKYIKDEEPLNIRIFEVNELIADQQELQSIKDSQINNPLLQLENTKSKISQTEMSIQYDLNDINIDDKNGSDKNQVFNSMVSIQYSSQIYSQIISQRVNCIYCRVDISKNIISTPCQHFFHSECFDSFIYNTLQLSSPTLSCLCNQKLQVQILLLIGEEKYKKYKEQLLENQLFYLQQQYHNKIGRCIDNKNCKFWFFIQFNSQIHKKIICHECSTPQNLDVQVTKSFIQKKQIFILPHQTKQRKADTQSSHSLDENLTQDQGNKLNQIDRDNFDDNRMTKSQIGGVKKNIIQLKNDQINDNINQIQQNQDEQQILHQEQRNVEQVVQNQ